MHFIEGPCISILRVLSNLASDQHFKKNSVQSGNIVYNIEDRPMRFFPEWYSCTVHEKKSQQEELTEENSSDVIFKIASDIMDIGLGLKENINEDVDMSRCVL